jgi:ABC-2 type transport system permease protein
MRKVWIIARHEYAVNVRRVGFVLAVALVPVLGTIALLVAALFGGQAGSFLEQQFAPGQATVGVVDQVGVFSPILPAYESRFHLYADEDSGRTAVLSGEISNLVVIPADYMQTGKVRVLTKQGGLGSMEIDSARAFAVDHLLRNETDATLRQRLINPYEPQIVTLGAEGADGQGMMSVVINTIIAYVLGLMLVISIFTSSAYLLRGVSEEKSNRIIEIILSSVNAKQLLAGKVLGLGALGLTQAIVWLGSAFLLSVAAQGIMGVTVPLAARPEIFVLGLVYYLLGFLVYAVLTGSVGALGTTMQESQQLASIFSLMAAVPLMLGGVVINSPNMMIMRVLSWFPLTAPTMMLLRLPMAEVPMIDVIGSIVALLVAIPLILLAGAKVFRMGLLMYGKRPSIKQIAMTLRKA